MLQRFGISLRLPEHWRRRALRNPRAALGYGLAALRGLLVPALYRLRGIRFKAGRNFQLRGRVVVRGPGRVVFGDDVVVDRVVTPWTYSKGAVIRVGRGSYLNGTRIGCRQSVVIGEAALLSDVQISDTDFHSVHVARRSPDAPVRTLPIRIGRNVWIGASAGVLPGCRIGRDSVVGFGTVCTRTYPAGSVIAGNPGRIVGEVPGFGGPSPRDDGWRAVRPNVVQPDSEERPTTL